MPDEQTNPGPANDNQVNVSDPAEVQRRRRQFGCTEPQLRAAVAAVGASAAKVSQYLKRKSTPPKGKPQRFK